jgi:hypothetical protein
MWTLWSRGKAVVSHESALAVHGIGEFESGSVHLTVPRNFRMADVAVMLHRGQLPDSDIEDRVGFRSTTPQRTIIASEGLLVLRSLRSRAEVVDVGAALRIERALNIGVKR